MSATVEPLAIFNSSSAVSGCSSVSRSERTSHGAPATPMAPAYWRPVTGWTFCAQDIDCRRTTARNPQTVLRIESLVGGVDIGRDVLHAVDGLLHRGANHGQRIEHPFGALIITGGFERKNIVIQVAHGVLDLTVVHREGAVRVRHVAAFVHQVIELHGHAAAMRLGQAEQ